MAETVVIDLPYGAFNQIGKPPLVASVTLTRIQIEAALAELNKPQFRGGDKVRFDGSECVVASDYLSGALNAASERSDMRVHLIRLSDGEWICPMRSNVHAK